MPRQYTCCHPQCDTTGPANIFFNIPFDSKRQRINASKYVSLIVSDKWVVDHGKLICLNHFSKKDFLVDQNQKVIAIDSDAIYELGSSSRGRIGLKYSNRLPKYMFELRERDELPPNPYELVFDTTDFVVDFDNLKEQFGVRLADVDGIEQWITNVQRECLIFFTYSVEGGNNIKSSIKIDNFLKVQVTLSGRILDPLDLTKWMPPSAELTRWSQLKLLLAHFGLDKAKVMNVVFNVNLKTPKFLNKFVVKQEK